MSAVNANAPWPDAAGFGTWSASRGEGGVWSYRRTVLGGNRCLSDSFARVVRTCR